METTGVKPIRYKFPLDDMLDMTYGETDPDKYKVVSDKITEHTRWSVLHQLVFKSGEDYFYTTYSTPATEYQETETFDQEDGWVEVYRCIKTTVPTEVFCDEKYMTPIHICQPEMK